MTSCCNNYAGILGQSSILGPLTSSAPSPPCRWPVTWTPSTSPHQRIEVGSWRWSSKSFFTLDPCLLLESLSLFVHLGRGSVLVASSPLVLLPVLDVLLSPQGFSLLPLKLLGFSILWVGVQIQNTIDKIFLVLNTSLYFSCMRSLAASMASILARYASGSFFIAAASAACSRFSWRSAISQTFHLVNHLPAMKRIYLQVAPSPLEKSIDKSWQGKEDVYMLYHPRSTCSRGREGWGRPTD